MTREMKFSVAPEWRGIGAVHDSMVQFLSSNGLPESSADEGAMIVCELVENGIKYGAFESNGSSVSVTVALSGTRLSVVVSNPVDEGSKPYLQALDSTIQWVRGFQDPFEAYLDRMRAISREPLFYDKSGLGIVRICYEGRAALDFYIEEDRTLTVSAIASYE